MRTLYVASFLTLSLLTGCASTGSTYRTPDVQRVNEKTGKVEYVSNAKTLEMGFLNNFNDLPIPSSHKADLSQSMMFSSPSQSIGRITLKGPADMDSLFRFYEDNMNAKGWKMVNAFQASVSSLYYAKPGRFAAIVIDGDGTIIINIGPE